MLNIAGRSLTVPILQGGMGVGVSLGGLAGAVAACGGMGCISTADTGYREPDFATNPMEANRRALAAEIQKAKQLANGMGMVAINAMVATRNYADAVRTAVEAGADAIVSGAGLPLELPGRRISRWPPSFPAEEPRSSFSNDGRKPSDGRRISLSLRDARQADTSVFRKKS